MNLQQIKDFIHPEMAKIVDRHNSYSLRRRYNQHHSDEVKSYEKQRQDEADAKARVTVQEIKRLYSEHRTELRATAKEYEKANYEIIEKLIQNDLEDAIGL